MRERGSYVEMEYLSQRVISGEGSCRSRMVYILRRERGRPRTHALAGLEYVMINGAEAESTRIDRSAIYDERSLKEVDAEMIEKIGVIVYCAHMCEKREREYARSTKYGLGHV